MTGIAREAFAALLLTTLSAAVTLALLHLFGPDWSRFSPATCTTTRCFCEMPRSGASLMQPANSISSFGYVFAGFLMIIMARSREWASAFSPAAASVLGLTSITVGIGSVLLHATLTLWGQFFDVLGMYLISGFFVISALAKWLRFSNRSAMIYYALLCTALVAVLLAMPEVRRWLFGVILVAAIILEMTLARPRRPNVKTSFYVSGLIANIVAFTIWNFDQNGQLCTPQSLFQGHAVWHLLGALALWFVFLYYRSERPSQ